MNKDLKFINEHIANRMKFDDCFNEETMQQKANKAFYAVWTNYIFINPTTENLRELKEEDFSIIKKLSYGTKNRLQSYIAFHLNRDHYDMMFNELTEDQAYTVIRMCEEVFEDTKILVDWWRSPVESGSVTGEEWFQECKERFQKQKFIDRLGFCFIDMETKRFLLIDDNGVSWTTDQKEATRFNMRKEGLIQDQSDVSVQKTVEKQVDLIIKKNSLKMFHQSRDKAANDVFVEV